jgi:hypothetical protein
LTGLIPTELIPTEPIPTEPIPTELISDQVRPDPVQLILPALSGAARGMESEGSRRDEERPRSTPARGWRIPPGQLSDRSPPAASCRSNEEDRPAARCGPALFDLMRRYENVRDCELR